MAKRGIQNIIKSLKKWVKWFLFKTKGSTVILACRDKQRAQNALDKIFQETKSQKVFIEDLDLNDLSSVRSFAKTFLEKYDRLDILINNAGESILEIFQTIILFKLIIQA